MYNVYPWDDLQDAIDIKPEAEENFERSFHVRQIDGGYVLFDGKMIVDSRGSSWSLHVQPDCEETKEHISKFLQESTKINEDEL